MERIRFGIVGGAAGIAPMHIGGIRKNSTCELVCLTDIAQDKCRAIATQEGVVFVASYDEMLARRDVDAVAICTPHPSHCELALKALKAGKHVLVEKPMCVTVSEADRLVRAAARAKTKLGVVFQHRFRPEMQKARELLASGAVGSLYRTAMVCTSYRTQAYYDSGAWRATWRGEGGGVLLNQAPHYLDLFQWLGGMPKKVYAWTPTLAHDIEVEDCASALLEYENGAQGFLHVSTVQAPNQERLEFCGDNGRLVVENGLIFDKFRQPLSIHRSTDPGIWSQPEFETQRWDFPPPDFSHVRVYEGFARAVLAGQEPPVTAAEGRKSVEFANALILSHYKRKTVTLPVSRSEYDRLFARLRSKSRLTK